KITVTASIYGKNLGNGVYGGGDASASFTVGPAKVAIANNNSHFMQVFFDGQMVRNIPVSMGKGGTVKAPDGRTVNFWTTNGPHVVIEKTPSVQMTSKSFGIIDPKDPNFYDETVRLTVRISDTGEVV